MRLDDPLEDARSIEHIAVDGGHQVTTGPNVIVYRPEHTVEGRYRIALDVAHLASFGHPHGAGLILGGSALDLKNQAYTYFLVRGDGDFIIKTRKGEETFDVVPWQSHEAVHADDDEGVARNTLAVDVGPEHVVFSVNEQEVQRAPAGSLPTDGIYGVRLVHNLVVRFSDYRLEQPE